MSPPPVTLGFRDECYARRSSRGRRLGRLSRRAGGPLPHLLDGGGRPQPRRRPADDAARPGLRRARRPARAACPACCAGSAGCSWTRSACWPGRTNWSPTRASARSPGTGSNGRTGTRPSRRRSSTGRTPPACCRSRSGRTTPSGGAGSGPAVCAGTRCPPRYCKQVLAQVRAEGPLTATQLGGAKGGGPWWDWSAVKVAAEWLLDIGELVCVRRTGWRRVYDLPERVGAGGTAGGGAVRRGVREPPGGCRRPGAGRGHARRPHRLSPAAAAAAGRQRPGGGAG